MKLKLKSLLISLNLLVQRLWANDVVERAVQTAWQAFFVVWSLSGFKLDKGVLGAAAGAALSALKTFVVSYAKGRRA